MTVVLVRSYSRMTGRTSCDSDTDRCGQLGASRSPIACSWAGLAYAWSRQTAMASTPVGDELPATARSACARSSGVRTCAVDVDALVDLAGAARARRAARGFSQIMSYSRGTRRRRSSRTSRKPRVVSRPVRAPLSSRMVLVATVVPWTTSRDGARARRRARAAGPDDAVDDGAAEVVGRGRQLAHRMPPWRDRRARCR